MKKSRKVLAILLSLALAFPMVLSVVSCNGGKNNVDGKKTYTIGICQLTTHDALDAATTGFQDALKKELGEGNVTFDLQNASNDIPLCTTIVNSFVSKKVDLILANATPALQAAYSATDTIPILGTSVTEYGVALGLKDFDGTVGGNVSGTSDLAPLNEQVDMLLSLFPNTERVGLLYCSAEPNSKFQARVVTEYLLRKGVSCTGYPFSDANDVISVTNKAAAECDVLYIPTDNTAASCSEIIGGIVKERKVPVIAGESGICKGCGVATLSISYYDLGYKTGLMAAKILRGESDISTMPIEYAAAEKKYNPDICAALGIIPPAGYEPLS